MSTDTRELIEICEQLPADKRTEVADFARFLLARSRGAAGGDAASCGAMQRWLAAAPGAARPGVTTDEVMSLTRGEP